MKEYIKPTRRCWYCGKGKWLIALKIPDLHLFCIIKIRLKYNSITEWLMINSDEVEPNATNQ